MMAQSLTFSPVLWKGDEFCLTWMWLLKRPAQTNYSICLARGANTCFDASFRYCQLTAQVAVNYGMKAQVTCFHAKQFRAYAPLKTIATALAGGGSQAHR